MGRFVGILEGSWFRQEKGNQEKGQVRSREISGNGKKSGKGKSQKKGRGRKGRKGEKDNRLYLFVGIMEKSRQNNRQQTGQVRRRKTPANRKRQENQLDDGRS